MVQYIRHGLKNFYVGTSVENSCWVPGADCLVLVIRCLGFGY